MFVRYNPIILFGAMVCGFYVYLFTTKQNYYTSEPSVLLIYIVDTILCLLFLLLLVAANHNKLVSRYKKFKMDIISAIKSPRTIVLIYVLLSLLVLLNWQVVLATFVLNEKKEIFLTYIDYGYSYHLITPIFIILSASRLSFGFGLPIIVMLAFFLFIAALQNKTLFLMIIYFSYIFWWLSKLEKNNNKGGNLRLVIMAAGLIGIAALTVLLQERRASIADALTYSIDAFFRFQVIGFYMSNELFNIERGVQGATTALFGVVAEKISMLFGGYGMLTDGFIAKRVEIGPNNSQNAIYPWSVWLYAQLGVVGLMLKYILVCSLFWLFLTIKFNASLFYLLVLLIFISLFRHPFLNVTDLYFFVTFLLLDIYLMIAGLSFRVRLRKL